VSNTVSGRKYHRNDYSSDASYKVENNLESQGLSQDIINMARKLDHEAITEIFEYYYPKMYRFFCYRARTSADAEDLASEVFEKMVKSIGRQHGNFEAWIYRIAKNTLTDYYRRKAVRKEDGVDTEILEALPQDREVPGDTFTQDELKTFIGQLGDEQKQVILFKFIEGYDNEKIASIMGKSVGAVKALQFRALIALRGIMRDE